MRTFTASLNRYGLKGKYLPGICVLSIKSLTPKGLPLGIVSKNSFNGLFDPKIEGFDIPVE